eukprot:TRINITY_DN446_c0_g1_i2.p1 TRINITY_DN446_c0_g1~~TRINITY_DN446_c0_g1_i2.p1  ORF type:complete len:233 (-),score=45.83 TRINITY_DN446_c0_g1_i2:806-1504(-)
MSRFSAVAMRLAATSSLLTRSAMMPMAASRFVPVRSIYEKKNTQATQQDSDYESLKHFKIYKPVGHVEKTGTTFPHLVYSPEELKDLKLNQHHNPSGLADRVAYYTVQFLRRSSDVLMGTNPSPKAYLNRFIYLETVAAVPGMVAGLVRHLNSLRNMTRDKGWIHSVLEEAENERMHLMTWMEYRKPSKLMRASVIVGQGLFYNVYFLAYLLSPRTAHRFVGMYPFFISLID